MLIARQEKNKNAKREGVVALGRSGCTSERLPPGCTHAWYRIHALIFKGPDKSIISRYNGIYRNGIACGGHVEVAFAGGVREERGNRRRSGRFRLLVDGQAGRTLPCPTIRYLPDLIRYLIFAVGSILFSTSGRS